jgi:hypothetical protein
MQGTIWREEIRNIYQKRWVACGWEKEYQENAKDEKE